MKCFSIVILFLFLLNFSTFAQVTSSDIAKNAIENIVEINSSKPEVIDIVVPYENKKLLTGELYEVKILSQQGDDELLKYKNSRINDIMFVTDVIIDKIDGNRFEVFVTTPPKKPSEKKPKFQHEGFEYVDSKKDLQGDLKLLNYENPFDFNSILTPDNIKLILGLILGVILSLFILGGRFLFKYLQKRKARKDQVKIYTEMIKTASSKEHFENIFRNRKEIIQLLDLDQKEFKDFINKINDYQYQRLWQENYTAEILNLRDKITIHGENRGI